MSKLKLIITALILTVLLFTSCIFLRPHQTDYELPEGLKGQQVGAWIHMPDSQKIKIDPAYIQTRDMNRLKPYFGFQTLSLAEQDRLRDKLIIETNSTKATYYIDAVYGDDRQNGTSPHHAWRTIQHMQSQKIPNQSCVLLKRGQRHELEDSYKTIRFTGSGSSILFSAYGEGAMPIIEPKKDRPDLHWQNNGDGTWSTQDIQHPIKRMWMDGIEIYQSAAQQQESIDPFYPWELIQTNHGFQINLLSQTDPTHRKIEFYQRENTIFMNRDRLYLVNLDIRGGNKTIKLYGSNHSIIKNCKIGQNSLFGIYLESSSHTQLSNVEVVSGQIFQDQTGKALIPTQTRTTTQRGAFEGIRISKKSYDNFLTHITLNGWTHAAYNLYDGPKRNFLSHFLVDSTVLYGDSFTFDYDNTQYNEVFNGLFINLKKSHQLNGQYNKFYNNIIYKVEQSEYADSDTSMAIEINPYAGNIIHNEIYYNTFINAEGSAVMFKGTRPRNIEAISLYNNLFYDCGNRIHPKYQKAGRESTQSAIILLETKSSFKNITFKNNLFINTINNSRPFVILDGKSGSWIAKPYSIELFNQLNSEFFKSNNNYVQ